MITLSSCPICNSESITLKRIGRTFRRPTDGKRWPVYECGNCAAWFLNPQPTWGELAPFYGSSYDNYDAEHCLIRGDLEEEVKTAVESREYGGVKITVGMRILDVGCGGGSFLNVAKKIGAVVQGVEPSKIGSSRAQKLGIPVFCGTLKEFVRRSSQTGHYDLIRVTHVLEHVPDPVADLRLMVKLLAQDGIVRIGVPNRYCPFGWMIGDQWMGTDLPRHLFHFTPKSLRLAACNAGLHVITLVTESLDRAVAQDIRDLLRYRFLVPRRISLKFPVIENTIAPLVVQRLDSRDKGQAIVCELRKT